MLKKVEIYTHNLQTNKILRTSVPAFFLDRYKVNSGVVIELDFYNSDKRIIDLESYRKGKTISECEFLDVDSFFIGETEERLLENEFYRKLMLSDPRILNFASKRDAFFRVREIIPVCDYNYDKISIVNSEQSLLKIYRMKIGRDLK